MPSKSITDQQRRRVLELHGQGKGRNAIADEVGVALGSVSKIVKAAGLSFDRTATASATEARKVDMRARRTELAHLLLEDAHRLRAQLWEPCKAFNFGGKDNTYNETELDEPVFADKLKIMQAAGAAIGRHIDIEQHDAEAGVEDAKSMLAALGRALGVRGPDDA